MGRARWRGTELTIRLSCGRGACEDHFQVLLDGREGPVLRLEQGRDAYQLTSGLSDAEHHVEVRRTDSTS